MPIGWVLLGGAALQTAIIVGAWWSGHNAGRESLQAQLDAVHATADAQQAQYRKLQEDAGHAQAQIIDHYRRQAAADRRSWDAVRVRLEAAGTSDVPDSGDPPGGHCASDPVALAPDGGAHPRPLPRPVADAVRLLEVGAELERELARCREQLRAIPCGSSF